jgi:hypothetical protein
MLQILGRQCSGPLQDRGHDREVARGNHAHAIAAGQTVKFRVVVGGVPARADDRMRSCSYGGYHVLLHRGGTRVVDEDIDLRGLQRLGH